jgi:hypothetical protein
MHKSITNDLFLCQKKLIKNSDKITKLNLILGRGILEQGGSNYVLRYFLLLPQNLEIECTRENQ